MSNLNLGQQQQTASNWSNQAFMMQQNQWPNQMTNANQTSINSFNFNMNSSTNPTNSQTNTMSSNLWE
jgi:hypothetical protein